MIVCFYLALNIPTYLAWAHAGTASAYVSPTPIGGRTLRKSTDIFSVGIKMFDYLPKTLCLVNLLWIQAFVGGFLRHFFFNTAGRVTDRAGLAAVDTPEVSMIPGPGFVWSARGCNVACRNVTDLGSSHTAEVGELLFCQYVILALSCKVYPHQFLGRCFADLRFTFWLLVRHCDLSLAVIQVELHVICDR